MILVGWIARRTRHPRRAAPALVLAVPGEIVVRLAHPTSVATAGALDCAPQDRSLSHASAARSAADACPRGPRTRRWLQPPLTSHPAHTRCREADCVTASSSHSR